MDGVRRFGENARVRINDRFDTGPNAKPMTAALSAILVES
jgi:hypothetical protein